MTDLPTIPSRYVLRHAEPEFVRWEGQWAVLGPDHLLIPGRPARVFKYSARQFEEVTIGEHLAARTVTHQRNSATYYSRGKSTRYVVAAVARESTH